MVESQVQNTEQRPLSGREGAQLKGSGAFSCIQAGQLRSPRPQASAPWPLSLETLPNGVQDPSKELTLNDEVLKNVSNAEVLQLWCIRIPWRLRENRLRRLPPGLLNQ